MNGNFRGPAGNRNAKGGVWQIAAASSAIVILTVVAAKTSMFAVIAVASAAALYLIMTPKGIPFAAASAAVSFGVTYLITKDLTVSAENFATLAVMTAVYALCLRLEAGFFKSSLIIGVAAAVVAAAILAISLYSVYGNVIEGAKDFAKSVYENVLTNLRTILDRGDGTMLIAENELRELLSLTVTLSPGLAAAAVEIAGAMLYAILKLTFRVFGIKFGRRGGEYEIPRGAVVFFTFSFVLALIFSLIKSLELARLAAINLAFVFAPPTIADGAFRMIRKIKNPPSVQMPDGTVLKRPPIFLLGATLLSGLINPVFPVAMLLTYSVIGTVKDIIKSSKGQDGK